MGNEVVLLPGQHVKAYLRGQKKDYNDAQELAETCLLGAIRPVPMRTAEQQRGQAFHRIRKKISDDRTALILQL